MPPFESLERVLERAEAAADNTRWECRLSGPVSPFEIAKVLKIPVVLDRHMRARGMTAEGEPIWLREGDRETRTNSACAHELGHRFVYDGGSEFAEKACDRFAAALLMPRAEFAETVRDLGVNPLEIAKVWKYSSAEAITRRIAEVVPGVRAAGWLELNARWREPRAPAGAMARLELNAVGESYCRARGWAVAEGQAGVIRVWRTGTAPRSAVSVLLAA